jgi:hypothetical protein
VRRKLDVRRGTPSILLFGDLVKAARQEAAEAVAAFSFISGRAWA